MEKYARTTLLSLNDRSADDSFLVPTAHPSITTARTHKEHLGLSILPAASMHHAVPTSITWVRRVIRRAAEQINPIVVFPPVLEEVGGCSGNPCLTIRPEVCYSRLSRRCCCGGNNRGTDAHSLPQSSRPLVAFQLCLAFFLLEYRPGEGLCSTPKTRLA